MDFQGSHLIPTDEIEDTRELWIAPNVESICGEIQVKTTTLSKYSVLQTKLIRNQLWL